MLCSWESGLGTWESCPGSHRQEAPGRDWNTKPLLTQPAALHQMFSILAGRKVGVGQQPFLPLPERSGGLVGRRRIIDGASEEDKGEPEPWHSISLVGS